MHISRTLSLGVDTGGQIDLAHGLDNGDPVRTEVALRNISLECVTRSLAVVFITTYMHLP
jgi:hypothetical protein